jgi:tetratricopeptide (TPR) repeat protein
MYLSLFYCRKINFMYRRETRIKYLLFFYLFFPIVMYSQSDQGYVDVDGSVKFERRPIENAKIEIYENSLQIKQYASNISGKFNFKLDLDKVYILAVTKGGMVTKRIQFDTHVPENEIGIWRYKFTVEIFPMVEGLDIGILEKPIAIIKFDDDWGAFDYDEAYTNSILKDIDKLLKDYEDLKIDAYNKAIIEADAAYDKKEYEKAWKLYDRAIDFNPYDEYPDDMKFQIDKILSKRYANERNYEKAIAKADENFTDENWNGATTFYKKALSYKDEEYPKQKLKEIETILAQNDAGDEELKRIEEEFRKAMFAGDDFRKQKNYYEARSSYKKAVSIKPTEQLPKDNITELDILIAELEKNQSDKETKQKGYDNAIALADQDLANKLYSEAKINYQKALSFLPYEEYPQQKIREIDEILADKNAQEANYQKIIALADQLFNETTYDKSKAKYQEALAFKPNELYPTQKINEINQIIAQKQGKEAAYNQAIASADQFFQLKEYTNAKSDYENALQLKPNETYPQRQLQKVNAFLADLNAKDKNYQNFIAQADQYFAAKQFSQAKENYENALKIKANELYPQQKITEINTLVASLNQNQSNYDNLIKTADKNFNSELWNEAKHNYEQALQIFPNEIYPKNKIIEIDNKLLALKSSKEQRQALENNYNTAIQQGDQFFALKQYPESKAEYEKALAIKSKEKYPKSRIDEILKLMNDLNVQNQEYGRLVAEADAKFNGLKYHEAKAIYIKAKQIKSSESYPQQKINEIDQLLAKIEEERKVKEAKELKYANFITQADEQFKSKSYDMAKENYQNALGIKSTENYPRERINEIDNILSQIQGIETQYANQIKNADIQFQNKNFEAAKLGYENALSIKDNEVYPKTKIAEIEQILADLKAKQKEYDRLIATADKSFNKQDWNEAKLVYQQAISVFPEEVYPKNKITEIDNKLLALKNAEESRLEKEQAYNNAIANGDRLFASSDYINAKNEFEKAATLKPGEKYPLEKITEIDNKLAELKQIQNQYNNLIANADRDFTAKRYDAALKNYQSASTLKQQETYPRTKINEINTLLAQLKSQEDKYNQFITSGNTYFNNQNYELAKTNYENAISVKQNDTYALNKIKEIDGILKQKQKEEQELLAKRQQYDKYIKDADKDYQLKNYQNAIKLYQSAKNILPTETYPTTQINLINGLIAKEQKDLEQSYIAAIREGDQFYGNLKYEDAKASFERALFYKPNEDYPTRKLKDIALKIDQQRQENQERLEMEKKYTELVKKADGEFNSGDFVSAKSSYQLALNYKSSARYPQEQITKCDKLIQSQKDAALAAADAERQKQMEESKSSFENNDFDFVGGERSGAFLSDLAKKYPEGVTVENYSKKNKKIKRVIVNRKGIAKEYIEVKYSYGTYYFRNGQNISKYIFLSETKD